VGAGRVVVAVLGAEAHGAARQDLAHGRQRGERRAHHRPDGKLWLQPVPDAGGERARLGEGPVHLPVSDDERAAHQ
jgi:hypothetical protein